MVFECQVRFKVAFTTLSTAVFGVSPKWQDNGKQKVTHCTRSIYFGRKMSFQKRDVYPSNVWFINVAAFKSVIYYFQIGSNAPSNLLCNVRNLIFYFASAVFRCLSNDIALKGFLLQHCVVFFIILRCDSDFWTVFLRGLIFGLILLLLDGERLWLDIFGLKRNWNERKSF